VQYPPQKEEITYQLWPCPKREGAIAGSFVSGLAVGLVVCAIVAWVLWREIKRLRGIVHRAENREDFGQSLLDKSETPVNRDCALPRGVLTTGAESQPLLGDDRVLFDVEQAVSVRSLFVSLELIERQEKL